MEINIGRRTYVVEYQVILTVLCCFGWSLFYFFSTSSQPGEGPESVLLIKPLVVILAISSIFVVFSAVRVRRDDSADPDLNDGGNFPAQKNRVQHFAFCLCRCPAVSGVSDTIDHLSGTHVLLPGASQLLVLSGFVGRVCRVVVACLQKADGGPHSGVAPIYGGITLKTVFCHQTEIGR